MLRAFSTAATGMTAQQLIVDTIANNLANINTSGFKRSQVATQALAKGTTLRPGMYKETKNAVVIHRNEAVVMKYETAGFSLTGVGQAMDEGRPGDLIRVRNVDTNRILSARVGSDGVVQPVLSEAK